MRSPAIAVSVALLFLRPLAAQQRPLHTDDAALLDVGRIRAQFGIEFLHNQRYSLSGLEGDLTRLGVASLHVGVGEYAEFQLSGVAHDFLSVSRRRPPLASPDFAGNSTSDFGDIVLASKLRLAPESGRRPALAFKFAVELPNANQKKGLGPDETRFHASALLSKNVGRARVTANLGLSILPSPIKPANQADPLTYGFAVVLPVSSRLSLAGEINGRQGPYRAGNENQSRVTVGVQFKAAGLRWDVAGIAGLKDFDPDSGITIGVGWDFQAFHRQKRPTTVK